MPEALAFAPEAFDAAFAAEAFTPELGLAAADIGLGEGAALGATDVLGGSAAVDAGILGADATTLAASATELGGNLVAPSISTELAPVGEQIATAADTGLFGGSDLGVAVDQGGLAGEFSPQAAGPSTPPDIGMSTGIFEGQPQGGWPDYTSDPATFQNDPMGSTVTTTTGPAKAAGGGLFGSGLNTTQLATAALIGGMGMIPQQLSSPAKATQREAGILTSIGNQNLALAAENKISPAQQVELQNMRDQLMSRAVQQIAGMDPSGQIDPTKDSRFIGMVQSIDAAIAKQYQAFVDAEAKLGMEEVAAALGANQTLITELARQDAALNAALFRAGLAASALTSSGGGGTTTTTTIT